MFEFIRGAHYHPPFIPLSLAPVYIICRLLFSFLLLYVRDSRRKEKKAQAKFLFCVLLYIFLRFGAERGRVAWHEVAVGTANESGRLL